MNKPSVRDETNRYLSHMANAQSAMLNDPQYRWQIDRTRQMLELVDLALENEGIPADARLRVIRSVLLGAADESEAMRRIEQHSKQVAMLAGNESMPRFDFTGRAS